MNPFIPQKLPIQGIDYKILANMAGEANRALGKYDVFLSVVPNPDLLIIPLQRQEALDSNRIEGSQSSLDDVLSCEAEQGSLIEAKPSPETGSSGADDLKEIFNYRRALAEAQKEFEGDRPFTLNLLKKLHFILLDSVRGQNKARGEFRHLPGHQNWIGKKGSTLETATFVPPEPSRVLEFLGEWESYYHNDEPDPLIQLAIVHAQFELIHPFLDGNGRTGRMLIPLFLFERGIISRPVFYISSYLEQNRSTYMELLKDLGRSSSDWNTWAKFFLSGISEQARQNLSQSQAILGLYEDLKKSFLQASSSRYIVPVLDAMFITPIFTAPILKDKVGEKGNQIQYITLSKLLQILVQKDLLKVTRAGKGRSATRYSLVPLVKLLTIQEHFRQ